MPRPISRRELIRKLRKLGFVGPLSGGRHPYMGRGSQRISIPNPHGKDIGSVLLGRILREIGISVQDFEKI